MLRLAFLVNQAVMSSTDNDLPKGPRFSWDIRQVPWANGKGSQEDYVNAIKSRSSCHYKLPETNSNKMPKGLRRIMLHSDVYGRAKDLCKQIPLYGIESDDGVDKICKALHKKNALSVVTNAHSKFLIFLSRKRGIF